MTIRIATYKFSVNDYSLSFIINGYDYSFEYSSPVTHGQLFHSEINDDYLIYL